jgi:glutamate-5-semialdehyde dehydrogenase
LINEGCHIKGDSEVKKIVNSIELATEIDWHTEYLEAILSIKIVNGIKEAINHINKYSSNHTESIITENKITAETFLSNVDSAIVMHNTSTQFADGGEFGMGAEIGISTGRIHARGPVGAAQLTSFKYIVRGNDQIRG